MTSAATAPAADPLSGRRPPRISVVLLNCRAQEEEDTLRCVASLWQSDHPVHEIVVVDNGSPPDVGRSLEARLADVTMIHTGENLGFTGGNNVGIRRALSGGADYVWVLNNDTVVERECLSRLVEVAEAHPDAGAVGAKIVYCHRPDLLWFAGGDLSMMRGLGLHRGQGEDDPGPGPETAQEVSFLTGCCMLLRRRALEEVGGFEEDFFIYVEDVELSLRLRRAGYRLLYAPGARLCHRIPFPEPPPSPRKIVLRDRNRRRLARRRYGLGDRVRFALFFYPSRVVRAMGYLARGDWARFVAICRGATAR